MTPEIMQSLADFRDARGWGLYHTPRHLAEAISVEAGELLECYLWDGAFPRPHQNPAHEVADVLIFALSFCLAMHLDPETIIREKMALNAQKYPVSRTVVEMTHETS